MPHGLRANAQLRAAAGLLAGAFVVHWLRYLFAYGGAAGEELHRQGHGYLQDLLPAAVALCTALIVASLAVRLLGRGTAQRGGSVRRSALVLAIALLAIYSTQELAEGVLSPGHHSGLQALSADSGWLAVPLAGLVSLLLAWVGQLLGRAEERVCILLGLWSGSVPSGSSPPPQAPAMPFVCRWAHLALAFGLARRPPPALLSP